MTTPDLADWERVAEHFGVALEQVRRDHLVSHVLGALSADVSTEDLVFFGGTALSRTHLTDARLSEDIDLIALTPRTELAERIERSLRRRLARSHGRPVWQPALTGTSGGRPAVLGVEGVAGVRVQLVSGVGYSWPTELRRIEQRYPDAPPARLRTLTAAGFAAAKLTAWSERRASRDLYDLWALSRVGLVDRAAVEVFVQHGPTNRPPQAWMFTAPPDEAAWHVDLGHQTRLRVTAVEALDAVRTAWLAAVA